MRKTFVIVVLAVVFALALIQDGQSITSKTFHVQGIDSVVSAQLVPAHAGAGGATLTLDVKNAKDREVVAKVLNWINSSQVVGDAKDQFISMGGSPTEFTIKFQSGDAVRVTDAIGTSAPKKIGNGIQIHSTNNQNQVTISQSHVARRIVAPELKAWIEGGWQQEEPLMFTPEQAISKVVKEHPEFPATGDKQVFEDIGGIQGHKQQVTLTTKVEKRGLLEYIVTLTKNYNLTIGGKGAIQSWVYNVDPSNVTLIDQQGNVPSIK